MQNTKSGFSPVLVLLALLVIAAIIGWRVIASQKEIPPNKGTITEQPFPTARPTPTFGSLSSPTPTSRQSKSRPINFTVTYGADITATEEFSRLTLMRWGPTQKAGVDFYDGLGLVFSSMTLTNQSLEEYVDEAINSYSKGELVKPKAKIVLNNYSGFSHTVQGLGIHEIIILQSPYSKNDFVEIFNSTNDPTNQGFSTEVSQILSTFAFLKD